MKKSGFFAFLFLACFTSVCMADESTQTKGMEVVASNSPLKANGNRFAFLVAVNDYAEVPNLHCTVNDAKALQKQLLKMEFSNENIRMLTSEESQLRNRPNKRNIERQFNELLKKVKTGDWVFVFLSGHGTQIPDTPGSYFCPEDVNLKDLENTTVSIDKMMNQLSESPASFRWMIVDACRDENSSKSIFGQKSLQAVSNPPANVSLIQSCQPGEFSYEGGNGAARDIENGFFTKSLLEAFTLKSDADEDGNITFSEMFQYITKRTDELARKYCKQPQVPMFTGQTMDFVLLTDDDLVAANALAKEAKKLKREKKYDEALIKIKKAQDLCPNNERFEWIEKNIKNAIYVSQFVRKTPSLTGNNAGERMVKTVDNVEYAFRWCPAGTFIMGSPDEDEEDEDEEDEDEEDEGEEEENEEEDEEEGEGEEEGEDEGEEGDEDEGEEGDEDEDNEEDDDKEDDEIQHFVTLTQGFWMLETEVTQEMWQSVMGTSLKDQADKMLDDDTPYSHLDNKTLRDWYGFKRDDTIRAIHGNGSKFPMYYVNWGECKEFCRRLSNKIGMEITLPTEAQWEYACRAGSKTALYTGDIRILGARNAPALNDIAWYGGNSSQDFELPSAWNSSYWSETQYPGGLCGTHQVGKKKPNMWGLYDMIGNVWEWCEDWYGDYPSGSVTDPTGPNSGSNRVCRGGGWCDESKYCRSAYRGKVSAGLRNPDLGFRLVGLAK